MWHSNLMFAAVLAALSVQAVAAPSAEEAAQLGKTLTPFGAAKAGNKEGTIPEWTGGICTPPAGYKPARGASGGAPYVDPFASEKPLFSITAENLAQHADKLDAGTKELFKRYPKTYRVDVYPTHRTACFPSWVYENTISRVMKPRLVGTAPGIADAHAQIPFPIPKSGYEAMWNAALKVEPVSTAFEIGSYLVDASGNATLTALQTLHNQNNYWDNSIAAVPEGKPYWALIARTIAPASGAGVAQMRHMFLRTDLKDPMAWSYIPGQRRVRLAPEFTYDTVSTTSGGVLLFDEINGFEGKMDKFDFKLLGKKEMYVPYNAYNWYQQPAEKVYAPNHANPDLLRFELHRVWVVEATLKPGQRHVEKKKVFYLDEDSWNILTYVGIDQADKPYHMVYQVAIQTYDKPEIRNSGNLLYDFNKRAYSLANRIMDPGQAGIYRVKPYPANYFTPDAFAGAGIR